MPSVSVAVPTRNRPDALRAALESLRAQTRAPDEVLVIDDSDTTKDAVRALVEGFEGVELLEKAQPGLTASRNLAADKAKGDILLYLDDDVILEPPFIEEIVKHFDDPEIAGAGGVIVNSPLQRRPRLAKATGLGGGATGRVLSSGWLTPLPRDAAVVEYLSGCNMAYRTDVVRRQRFDESFFLGYGLGEDAEFSHRIHSEEGRLVVDPRARLFHNSTTRKQDREFGCAEVRARPRIARSRFRTGPFVVASLALAFRHVSREPRRALGNIQGIVEVLRSRSK